MNVNNFLAIETIDMAVAITDIAVKASIGTLNALNNAMLGKGFEILIYRGMADVFAGLIQAIVDLPR